MIPKIIHWCWVGGGELPPLIQKCVESFSRVNPDYEIVLWDRSKFDIDSTLWTKQAFEKKKYAFVADYIRFYALYNYGGIYLDSDIECLKPFDDLLERKYFFGREWPHVNNIEAACMGAEPGLDWVKVCLDYYKDRAFINEDGTLEDVSLTPIMAERLEQKFPEVMAAMMDSDYFTAREYYSDAIKTTSRTYTIHHFTHSWIREDMAYRDKVRNKCLPYMPARLAFCVGIFCAGCKYHDIKTAFANVLWNIFGPWKKKMNPYLPWRKEFKQRRKQ